MRILIKILFPGAFILSLPSNVYGQTSEVFAIPNSRDIPVIAPAYSASGKNLGPITLGFTPEAGQEIWLVWNIGTDPISGTFVAIPEGSTITLTHEGDTHYFRITYM